jgi:DNA-binding LytR/AlgR family response regulator
LEPPIKIAICEDQADDMNHLADLVEKTLAAISRTAEILRFTSGEALLSAFRPGVFDVLFLDMYLGEMSGMHTARAIRQREAACQIVFTTYSAEFALESYQVSAAHYLVKPVCEADLHEVWARCIKREKQPEEVLTLLVGRKPREIPFSEILYAEADNKICRIHTCREVLTTRIPINQLGLMLSDMPFCRCHRGYIVNLDYVERADEDFIMKNGDTVYIRRSEWARIREMYFRHLIRRVRDAEQPGP